MASKMSALRAMFEQNNSDTSPPADRGRSPGGSAGYISASTSPRRQLSKVRTSFVTVERSGQLGLQLGLKRDTSGEPSMTKRRTSFSINEDENPQSKAERKQSIATEMLARTLSSEVGETIPEFATMTPLQTPAIEEDKQLGKPAGKDLKKGPVKTIQAEEKKVANGQSSNGPTNGAGKPTTAKIVDRPAATKTSTKPTPISTAKTNAVSKSSPKKSPLPKTPTTPNKPRTRDASTNTPERKMDVEKKTRASSLAPNNTKRPASKPPTTHGHGSVPKTRIPESPPQTGFNKPRPKSPTKPVKLPASLTAHTASSGSKAAGAPPPQSRQSLSRASGNIQSGTTRSPSRATVTSKVGVTRNPSALKSATNRPSLGPPPNNLKKQPSRASLSQSTAPADEGFLARMMRPTTASASKTAEKAPATPPKRSQSVKRPATRDGPMKRSGSPMHKALKEALPKAVVKPIAKAAEPIKKQIKKVTEKAEAPASESSAPKAESKTEAVKPAEPQVEEAKAEEVKAEEIKAEEVKTSEIMTEDPEKAAVVEDVKDELSVPTIAASESTVAEKSAPSEEPPVVTEEAVEIPETIKETPVVEKVQEPEMPEDVPAVAESKEVVPATATAPIKAEESTIVETPASPKATAPIVEEEDEEDAKARAEIAKLNAEFAKVSLEEGPETKA